LDDVAQKIVLVLFFFLLSSLIAIRKPSCCSLKNPEKLRTNVEQRPQVERHCTLRVEAHTKALRVVRARTHGCAVRMSHMAQPLVSSAGLKRSRLGLLDKSSIIRARDDRKQR
jgi:hypothetical protein